MINLLDYSNSNTTVINQSTNLSGDMTVNSSLDLSGTINGNLKVNGLLILSGTVNGNVECIDLLMLEKGEINGTANVFSQIQQTEKAVVNGTVMAENADISGTVNGNLNVENELVLRDGCFVRNDIAARILKIQPKAVVGGKVRKIFRPWL